MAALLGLFWRLLREGRLKVARGRSWQPEIGMEHASRGRRSGNKGVGARWRGRFRIFSARHCSRTKVSHAENSGMTMLFFLWRLLRCRACVDHRSGHAAPCHHGSGWHERVRGGFNPLRGATTGVVMRRRATTGVDGTRGLGGGFNPLRGATTGVVMRRRATTGVDGTRGLGVGV